MSVGASSGDYWRVRDLAELYLVKVQPTEMAQVALVLATGDRYESVKPGLGAACWRNLSAMNLAAFPLSGFALTWLSNTTIGVGSGYAPDTNNAELLHGTPATLDLATVGPRGLDAGALAAAKAYAIWCLSGPSGTTYVASLSFTSPTPPLGYASYGRRVGSFMSDPAVARVNRFQQRGSGVHRKMLIAYPSYDNNVLSVGSATSPTAVSCATFVPPSAISAELLFSISYAGAVPPGGGQGFWGPTGWGDNYGYTEDLQGVGATQTLAQDVPLDSSFSFTYEVIGATTRLNAVINGYTEAL
jgi:hypothetical protein